MVDVIFQSIEHVMEKCKGGYAGMYLINGVGLVGFRDPNGIRPIVFGTKSSSGSININIDSNSIHKTPAKMKKSQK